MAKTSVSKPALKAGPKGVPKVDKRIQKTKRLLTESLISLILEKGYGSVSIQDILEQAQVGRSTFYFHYENKDQLFLARLLPFLDMNFLASEQ